MVKNQVADHKQTTPQQSVATLNTTSFVEDSSVRTTERADYMTTPRALGAPSYDDQGLRTFFEKPVRLESLSWTQAQLENQSLRATSLATDLLSIPMWVNKLEGFRFFRGTAVYRLQVNAQPFQQGRLIMSFLPQSKQIGDIMGSWHTANLACMTQLPHVELDARDTTAVLRIPYISPTSYIDLLTEQMDWGSTFIRVLSPLESGDGSNADVSVWLSFEDIEFAGPINPQGGGRPGRKSKKTRTIGSLPVAHEEARKAAQGQPVTEFIGKAQDVASVLSGVPVLSAFAAPAVWALGLAKKVTGIFGWSKPDSDSAPVYMVNRPNRQMNNTNGLVMSESMGLLSTSSISGLPGFAGTDDDEMSFGFLKTFMCYQSAFTWSATDVTGQTLWQKYISPANLGLEETYSLTGGTLTTKTYCPMFKLAQHFALYRGSIKLHVKIIKTDYHSGRLIIKYVPTKTPLATEPTTADGHYVLREIIDIRETSELILTLPYLSNVPYISAESYIGLLNIQIMNELRAPTTCSNSLQILMYFGPGDDFELAKPKPTPSLNIYPQGGQDESLNQETLVTDKPIGNAEDVPFDFFHSTVCIGELVTSVKMLINKFYLLRPSTTITNVGSKFNPWTFSMHTYSQATAAYNVPLLGRDFISEIAAGYGLYRGSMRIMLTNSTNNAFPVYAGLEPTTIGGPPYVNAAPTSLDFAALPVIGTSMSSSLVASQDLRQGAIYTIPYYNDCPSSINRVYVKDSTNSSLDSVPKTSLTWKTNEVPLILRSAGEDFQFGYFIGYGPQFVTFEAD